MTGAVPAAPFSPILEMAVPPGFWRDFFFLGHTGKGKAPARGNAVGNALGRRLSGGGGGPRRRFAYTAPQGGGGGGKGGFYMGKVAVLIPCYNEEKTVAKVVQDYRAALPQADIYVYDNNSTDRTAELAAQAGAIVRREYRQGKGNVIRSMFRQIDADCYLMTDGDDTYPAEAAPQMVRMILEGEADMVNGDRLSSTYFTENKRPFHNGGEPAGAGAHQPAVPGGCAGHYDGLPGLQPQLCENLPGAVPGV